MGARICRTANEAFAAGWDEPCEHGQPDPGECRQCGLTDVEVERLSVVLGGLATPVRHEERAAA
ncbi:hypothetical protein KMT30_06735 [Streptomyces sp. IBSBF 2953]|nr:hypothetical protein [Streptomyces hayashii]